MQDGSTARPHFTSEDACEFAERFWGISGSGDELPSYIDQNFRITSSSGDVHVLKIAHQGSDEAELDLQNSAMSHLAGYDLPVLVPQPRPSRAGNTVEAVDAADGTLHRVRMVPYLTGVPLAGVNPRTDSLLDDIGRGLGAVDQALMDFRHPASRRGLVWDLRRAHDTILSNAHHVADRDRRTRILRLTDESAMRLEQLAPALRESIVHNDANDHNLLVSPVAIDGSWERTLSGLIDFGDLMRSFTVAELAIAIAYCVTDVARPIATALPLVRGYHSTLPLEEAEVAALFDLVRLRLCTSLVVSTAQGLREPANEYLTISGEQVWTLLLALEGTHPDFAHYAFRHACGWEPCPQSSSLRRWLRTHPDEIGPVVIPDIRTGPVTVFDLGIGSLEQGSEVDPSDTAAHTERMFARMDADGAGVGIGLYDEARRWYASDAYRSTQGEDAEWRTVHTGIDLFMRPGSSVLAPLPGRVHSLRHNSDWLDYGPTVVLEHQADKAGLGGDTLTFHTLYGHLSEDTLEGLSVGDDVERGQEIARIGDFPVNGDWVPHLHFQIVMNMLGREGEFPGVALASEREIWLSLSPDPNGVLRIPDLPTGRSGGSVEEIVAERARRLGANLRVSYRRPLKIVRGSRQFLYDDEGQAYLDGVNNVPHVGHSHPRVVAAASRQMGVLNTNTRYLHDELVRYVRRLAETLPEPLGVCFLVNSGSEANELALRLARTHTGREDVVVVESGYHGNTNALIDVSHYKFASPGGTGPKEWVHVAPIPDPYRGAHGLDDADAGSRFAEGVKEAFDRASARGGAAAFLCETLIGCGGQVVPPEGYLAAAYRHARAAGAVCIADEVQIGFGRVGSHFWGFETQGAVPDVVTLGKPIGNGHPLGAVITTPEIAASFDTGMEYFNTFGGNPVSCAVGLAVLDVIFDEGLQENARVIGAELLEDLRGLMERHPIIGDVRGVGFYIGVELVRNRQTLEPAAPQASYAVERMRDHRILLSTDGPLHNVLKVKPPLVFTAEDARRLVRTLDAVLAEDYVREAVEG